MRQIEVDVDVFALIWANRRHPENNENEILKRVLEEYCDSATASPSRASEIVGETFPAVEQKPLEVLRSKSPEGSRSARTAIFGKTRWVDDVRTALVQLGGVATLHQIYRRVEDIRREAGRSTPKTLEATVRRTIEDHSSDSDNFRGTDLFAKVSRGEWALREWVRKQK